MVELDLDEKDTKRVILEKHKDMIEYQSKCTATLNLLRGKYCLKVVRPTRDSVLTYRLKQTTLIILSSRL